MKIILLVAFFIIVCIAFFAFFFALYQWVIDKTVMYLAWMKTSLKNMFYMRAHKYVAQIVLFSIVVFSLIGAILPGGIINYDIYSLNRAAKLNLRGDYYEAIKILVDYRNASSPFALNEIGVSYLGMRDLNLAVLSLEKAVSLEDHYVQAHLNLASAYYQLDRGVEGDFEIKKARAVSKYEVSDEDIYGSEQFRVSLISRIVILVLAACIGSGVPGCIIWYLNRRRIKLFDDLLPEGLRMATNGLRAGLSLGQVFEMMAKEAPVPLSQEFSTIVKEQKVGEPLDSVLQNLYKRIPTDDTSIFVTSTITLKEVGGNLPEVFEKLAETILERKLLKQKIVTMTAEGRIQGIMLLLLPFLLGFILNKLNPKDFSLLFTTPLGIFLMIAMSIWAGIGAFFMWKIVQVKV